MVWVRVSGEPSKNRRLMMSFAETSRASANSETVAPSLILTMSRSSGFWSLARASLMAASWRCSSAAASRRSLRFLRRPDSRVASAMASRASARMRSRLYSCASRAMRA